MYLSAVVALEVGKNRVEAVGEVQEAADLIDEYARQFEEHEEYVIRMRAASAGETNTSILRPYGVFGVIAPFNFPSALSAGPIGAALVAGNTVVFKPAETTPWSGVLLVELMHEAGVPAGALQLVTGGPEAGKALVAHARRRRHRLHGLVRGRPGDRAHLRHRRPVRAALHHGDGRQEPGHRDRERRPRPRRRGHRALGVRRERAEVLGVQPRAGGGVGTRRAARAAAARGGPVDAGRSRCRRTAASAPSTAATRSRSSSRPSRRRAATAAS